MALDHWVAAILAPLALWVILNGLDDLVIDVAALVACIVRVFSTDPAERTPTDEELAAVPERRIAIFVPLWEEQHVIGQMIDANTAHINYSQFDFFVGVYPNDTPTIAVVHETMRAHSNVHQALCPHEGPTSKADCLNWIYQRMLLYEQQNGARFDMVVIHDAEDVIDPDALRWINYYSRWFEMVQLPILALRTPPLELVHGVYCDEFAESQFKDMQARQLLGGFIPSTGVGAGFTRRALDRLAESNRNRVFDPESLTEDYEIGVRIHSLGMRQKFVPIRMRRGSPVATREYFPRTLGLAVRQRSRWVAGNALQAWERYSAAETLRYFYWFWRDRKGLAANLTGPLANLLFIYGVGTWIGARAGHHAWGLARESGPLLLRLSLAGAVLQVLHTSIRGWCSAQIYGWTFAAAVPFRIFAANWVNCFATVRAMATYSICRITGRPLQWAKTEHLYPSRAVLINQGRSFEDILVASRIATSDDLKLARETLPKGVALGDHLLALGFISERDLYSTLARHHGVAFGKPRWRDISVEITRMFPASLCRRWRMLAFRAFRGELHVATAGIPPAEAHSDIRRFTTLELRYQIVTPADFEELAREYLPRGA